MPVPIWSTNDFNCTDNYNTFNKEQYPTDINTENDTNECHSGIERITATIHRPTTIQQINKAPDVFLHLYYCNCSLIVTLPLSLTQRTMMLRLVLICACYTALLVCSLGSRNGGWVLYRGGGWSTENMAISFRTKHSAGEAWRHLVENEEEYE